jgi:predicted TIM-barrel fold metal-dependent hydrolase
MTKLWTSSGDSHFLEPPNLFREHLPREMADRLPRSEKISDTEEIVHIDGRQIRRNLPRPKEATAKKIAAFRAAQFSEEQGLRGSGDAKVRLEALDDQGVWGEVVFPSLGLWYNEIGSPDLVAAAARVLNDYVHDELIRTSPRFVPTATLPLQSVEASIAEVERVTELGFQAVFLPTGTPDGMPYWSDETWDPLWDVCAETGQVLAWHIGTENGGRLYRGRGGSLLNYVQTSFGGQAAAVAMIASGTLERLPSLKVLISEGGATWAPFVGDRMNEFRRQQPMWDEGLLSMEPKDYLNRQVYASFQHDVTAVPTMTAMGYRNVMFGTDYPHLEGTYPHTQKVLHELLDGVDPAVSDRIRLGAFAELFPRVGRPPTEQP